MAHATTTISPAAFSTFGELLRYLRRRQRMTQIELAIAVGYSTAQISRLEQNLRRPNPSTLQALFIPILNLEHDSELAARLLELAHAARDKQYPDSSLAEPEPTGDPGSAGQEPETQPPQLNMFDAAASTHILLTKLYLPRTRPDLVPRPRLLTRLDAALHVPLTLVVAPAGFGKTTLLAAWLARQRQEAGDVRQGTSSQTSPLQPLVPHSAWLALDDGDNDPMTFLRYLIAAFQTIGPEVGHSALALLQTSQPPAPEAMLRSVLNDLATLPYECLLVLDDYHLIATLAVHQMMVYLVEHLPPQLHLILASREDPPLPQPRLRARSQLVELRASELRFTHEEADTFLRDGMRLPLSMAEVTALETRTEGWIAGLQLAALAMRGGGDLADFISAFTGSNHFVGEYLVDEVFMRQPPHLQAFLLQTAILDRMCAALCDAVMGVETAQRPGASAFQSEDVRSAYSQLLLEQLERSNLFTIALDDQRRWFRYHHLFGEALRERLLSGAMRSTIASLHQRASVWYEQEGLIAEAVHHGLSAQDWERAACLTEEHGSLLMGRGQLHTVIGWLNALPAQVMQQRPHLCIVHAVALLMTKQVDAAEMRLHDAECGLQPVTPDEMTRVVQGRVAMVRGIIRLLKGDLPQMISLMQRALAVLPDPASNLTAETLTNMVRAVATLFAAMEYKLTGDVSPASERRAAEAIAPVRTTGNLTATLYGYTSLAALQVLQGRLRAAAATYAEVERLIPDQDALQAVVGSLAYYFGLGDLMREWNQLDAADGYLTAGMALVQGGFVNDTDTILRGYLASAWIQQAQGHGESALATLDAFMQVARERDLFSVQIERAAALRAQLQLLQGDLAPAIRWADGSGLSPDDNLDFPREAAYLTLTRVRIAAGRPEEVVPLLDRLLADAESKARMHSAIEILVVQALAYDALNDRPHSLATLEHALTLAEPEGYVRMLVDEGVPMLALLRAAASQGIAPVYAVQLLSAGSSLSR